MMHIEEAVGQDGNPSIKKIWETVDFEWSGEMSPQTKFAYLLNDKIDNGFYIEVGAGEPIKNNHTYNLEDKYNWNGVSIDISEKFVETFNKVRKNKCIHGDATTFNWEKYLQENNFPKNINFLSIDIDQISGKYANLHALINLPITKYRFKIISIEHNFGTDFRNKDVLDMQRGVLLSLNYSLLYRGRNDDLWVDELVFNSMNGYDIITGLEGIRL